MKIADSLINELERESAATLKLLDRVPADKLDWRPHPKSMTLGELAWHIASLPRVVASSVEAGKFDVGNARPAQTRDSDDFSERLKGSVAEAKRIIESFDDDAIKQPFSFMRGDQVLRAVPRYGALRTVLLNHTYHHRGQLTVYLRLLDVPLPATYGTSADESMY